MLGGGRGQACSPPMTTHCFPAAEFSIWTREAGAGGLAIAVEGPSKAEISFEDRKDGSCGVAYVVQEPGTEDLAGGRRGGALVRALVQVYADSPAQLPPPPREPEAAQAVRGRREARTLTSGGLPACLLCSLLPR